MDYYVGFDGGGTKTACVVLDVGGWAVSESVAGPSNPLRVGFEEAFTNLTTAAAIALVNANLETRHVRAVCAGLAGAGPPGVSQQVQAYLAESFPSSFGHVATDLEVALEAAVGPGAGVVLVAGTGSAAFGRNAAGMTARAGGHGPWIGDEGSAFDIGRRAVAAVARARDADAPLTLLGDMIPSALAASSWEQIVERVARDPEAVYPQIFPLVVEAAETEDSTAREILFTAALALSRIAVNVVRRLGLADREFFLGKSGGVFGHSRLLEGTVDSVLRGAAPRAEIGPLSVSPAVGAARLARRMAEAQAASAAPGRS